MAFQREQSSEDPARRTDGEGFRRLLAALEREHDRELAALRAGLQGNLPGDDGAHDAPEELALLAEAVLPSDRSLVSGEIHANVDGFLPTETSSIRPGTEASYQHDSEEPVLEGDGGAVRRRSKSMTFYDDKKAYQLRPSWRPDMDLLAGLAKNDQATVVQIYRSATGHAMKRQSLIEERNIKERCARCLRTAYPIDPASRLKFIWDMTSVFALMHDMVMLPLTVFDLPQTTAKTTMEWFILMFWTCDILMNFSVGHYNKLGKSIKDFRSIARYYITSWFTPDIAIVSTDWALAILEFLSEGKDTNVGNNVGYARMGKFARITRVARTFRLIRVAKLRELVTIIRSHFESESIAILWSLCGNVFTLLLLNHINACGWYLVSKSSSASSSTWISFYGQSDTGFWDKYLTALHWSLTLFTPASMDVQPQNLAERAYAVVALNLAMIMFTTFVSSVTAGMTRLRNIQADNVEHSFLLRKFLRENTISNSLAARVTRYIAISRTMHQRKVTREQVHLLTYLSGPLNIELQWELCSRIVREHVFFRQLGDKDRPAMRHFCCHAVRNAALAKYDTIFTSGVQAHFMAFLSTGSMVYRLSKARTTKKFEGSRRARIEKGAWFTESVLWVPWSHGGSMTALCECDVMEVEWAKFGEVVTQHVDALKWAKEYCLIYYEHLITTVEKYGAAWDIPAELLGRGGSVAVDDDMFGEVVDAERVEAELIDSESGSDDDVVTKGKTLTRSGHVTEKPPVEITGSKNSRR